MNSYTIAIIVVLQLQTSEWGSGGGDRMFLLCGHSGWYDWIRGAEGLVGD